MLVLVSQLIESCFGKLKHKLESIIAVLLLCVPTLCFAQSDSAGIDADSPAQVSLQEKSVLVLVEREPSNPKSPTSGANGVARIDDDSSGNATFTSRAMSPAPEPPQDLLIPENPSPAVFARPLANELRSETISPREISSPNEDRTSQTESSNDGSQALGTFATTNQSFQDQQTSFGSPSGPSAQGGMNSPTRPSNSAQLEQPNRFSRPINSGTQFSSQPPSLARGVPQNSVQSDASSSGFGRLGNNQAELAPMKAAAPNIRSFNTPENFAGQQQTPLRSSDPNPISYNAQAYGQLNDVDNNVRPTGFTRPVAPPTLTTNLAKLLIERYSADNVNDALPGQPTKMIEMLRQPIPIQQRRPMVHQYWETYYDWANYVSAKQYEQWLSRISTSVSPPDKALLEATLAVAHNNTLAAEIQLGKSQSGLLEYMPNWRSTDLLPLPNDLPLIQKYKTNYELYRSRQMMPVSLRGIDQMLPKTLDLIILRAEAVKVAKTASDQILSALTSGQSDVVSVLESGRIWRAAERDLVASVVSYNQAIGDYSMSVTGGYQSPEEVVAMLIAKPQAVVAQASSVLQRQPAQFNPNAQATAQFGNQSGSQSGNSTFGAQPRGQNSAGGSGQGQTGFVGGQSRQNFNSGSSGTSGFNLAADRGFGTNLGGATNNSPNDSSRGSSGTPDAAPIYQAQFGNRANSNAGQTFGPLAPAQQIPAGQGNGRAAQSRFGSEVVR